MIQEAPNLRPCTCRDAQPMHVYEERGKAFFKSLYGETGDNVQGLLDKISPDMGMLRPYPCKAELQLTDCIM